MANNRQRLYFVVTIIFVCPMIAGCAIIPYNYVRNIEGYHTLRLASDEPQIERGSRIPVLDGIGHYIISLPSKILLLNWRVNNHNISEENEEILKQYLVDNDLQNVKIRLNQYTPGAEWRRLFRNHDVDPFFRYTLGTLSLVAYTIFPGRFFAGLIGGDHYNPFTNTINLYSGHNAIVLHEAGHAKDFATYTSNKGLYAAARLVPFFPLLQEGEATGDAIGYYKDKGLINDEKEAYKVLYPAYLTYIGGDLVSLTEFPYYIAYAAVIPGHIFGWIKSASVEEESTPSTKSEEE